MSSIAGLVNSNRFYSMQYRPVIYTNWAHVLSFVPNTFALTSPAGYFGVPPTGLPTATAEVAPPMAEEPEEAPPRPPMLRRPTRRR